MSNPETSIHEAPVSRRLGVGLTILALIAAASMGLLVGFITGASDSPVGNVAIPAVGGLLAGLGVHGVLQGSFKVRIDALKATLLAAMVSTFCAAAFVGIFWGASIRVVVYEDIINLVGDRWRGANHEIISELRAFRARAHFSELPKRDYEDFMLEVVYPIINDDEPETRLTRLRAALTTMEAAFPKPEPKAKPEPAGPSEPATEPTAAE